MSAAERGQVAILRVAITIDKRHDFVAISYYFSRARARAEAQPLIVSARPRHARF